MTTRERWKAILEGRHPDRPVCDYWGTSEVTGRLRCDRIGGARGLRVTGFATPRIARIAATGRCCCGDKMRRVK
jgi:hypothetical protein